MKFLSSLIVTFIVSCVGWSIIYSGPAAVGVAVLVACVLFAYFMSIHLAFGSIRKFANYLEEMSEWAQTMIP